MTDRLDVHLFDRPVGMLSIEGELRSPGDWCFVYDTGYQSSDEAVPLSVALPLQPQSFSGALVRNWFTNLLPEGAVRETIERRLRIPSRDDFALLEAIGGECAGAVSIGASSVQPAQPDEETDLETLLYLQGDQAGEGAWALLGASNRLSLAGAQDKIAVVREDDGRLRIPERGEASTHILKPDSLRIRGIRDLEALGLSLARAIGMDAVNAQLIDLAGRKALLIERHDRLVLPDGRHARLHQEDFCQALGFPGELKYESQGGPTLAACADLIRNKLRLGPTALRGFLDWVAYCTVIGNADAHAKNLSLLSGQDGKRRLAPMYDLVPTFAIAESLVERTPALRIGAARSIDSVGRDDWRAFAVATGYAPRFVLDRICAVADAIRTAIENVANELVAQGADEQTVQAAALLIRDNARRAG